MISIQILGCHISQNRQVRHEVMPAVVVAFLLRPHEALSDETGASTRFDWWARNIYKIQLDIFGYLWIMKSVILCWVLHQYS